ncbi:MAG: lipid-A-disaccharide synthase N-terminal domain-containing protein [Alphaproteobacteria bacterium]
MHSFTAEQIWLCVGFLGQGLFFMRFFVQWLASEKQKKSVIPKAFWYFSLAGGVTLLSYAIYRQDPVFIIGQGTGLFIYLRNLYFIAFYKNQEEDDVATSGNAKQC